MRILVVDDVAVNRKLLNATLEAEGHVVVTASNGQEALAVLEHDTVDAVISDILMPKMDGYRLCHEVRRRQSLAHLAFIHYTSTYTSPGDRELSRTVGADGYLVKPVATEILLQTLAEATRKASERETTTLKDSEDVFMMKEYSVALIKKLEEKNRDLEQAMTELRHAHQALDELNQSLQLRVRERTEELEASNRELHVMLDEVKELSGLLPICSWCKKIKDGQEYWHRVEDYISGHTKARFTHSLCPECLGKQLAGLNNSPAPEDDPL